MQHGSIVRHLYGWKCLTCGEVRRYVTDFYGFDCIPQRINFNLSPEEERRLSEIFRNYSMKRIY